VQLYRLALQQSIRALASNAAIQQRLLTLRRCCLVTSVSVSVCSCALCVCVRGDSADVSLLLLLLLLLRDAACLRSAIAA